MEAMDWKTTRTCAQEHVGLTDNGHVQTAGLARAPKNGSLAGNEVDGMDMVTWPGGQASEHHEYLWR